MRASRETGPAGESGRSDLEVDARKESAALESAQAQQRSAAANQESTLDTSRLAGTAARGVTSDGARTAQAEAEAAEQEQKAAQALVFSASRLAVLRRAGPRGASWPTVQVRIGDFVTASTPLTSISNRTCSSQHQRAAERARAIVPGTPLELLDGEARWC